MDDLPIPDLLNEIARSGIHGVPVSDDPQFRRQLETCLEWGYRIIIWGGRATLIYNEDQMAPHWFEEESFSEAWDKLKIVGFLRIGSTNDEALALARRGATQGTLVYAEEQTAGRGRRGREWHSHAKTGLFFSLILRPKQPRECWPLLTHVASAALAETLADFSKYRCAKRPFAVDIKWPNDVLISGKKCAGILLETISEEDAAIVGIGMNMHQGSVPKALAGEAVCLDEATHMFTPRSGILATFLNLFQKLYLLFDRGAHAEVLERWKARSSMWNGVPVWISDGREKRSAVTCGLNEMGALLVRTPEGVVETVLAGDVSIRRI